MQHQSVILRPHSLINTRGKPHFGRFAQPVNDINVHNADYRTPMNKKASALRKHFAYKRFQYFGGISDELIFGCALADLRYLGVAFVYVYRLADGAMRTWQIKTPLAMGLDLTNRPDNGVSVLERGKKRIRMAYTLNAAEERRKQLEVDFGKDLTIQASMQENSHFESMALCTPCSSNGWVYAQKTAALPVKGEVRCELGRFELDKINCYGHHDFSAGFMRRETFWNWACFSGQQGKQPPLGLNVSWGVNETGYSENCFWVGEKLHLLPQVQFRFDRDDDHSHWRVSSENGQIDLAFTPRDLHRERLNAGIMASNFRQIFGTFKGHLISAEGKRYDIENQYGFVEDQYAKW
ncbi:MAG: DUF2804 domain-containing protein [Oleiphilaceae bacterium]|nr:DUF2804 domain-containing protein [Oleiphilaceae bacterium]